MNAPLILGISGLYHDSAAALVEGGEIIRAVSEERLSRRKGDARFPTHAIQSCLEALPDQRRLDAVAYYENPGKKAARILGEAIGNAPRGQLLWPATLRNLRTLEKDLPKDLLNIVTDPQRIHFVSHHAAHAASAFFPSPFESAALLVVDGVGESASTSIWSADAAGIQSVREIQYPNSLGLLYSAFTEYCGFKVNSGEYKLMGLAAFGRPVFKQKILDHLIDLREDGSFALDMRYFGFRTTTNSINPLFCQLFGNRMARLPEAPISSHYANVAASIQSILELAMIRLSRSALKITGKTQLCLAGGVALNCVSNGRIAREVTGPENLWIQPAAGDAGGALGAALLLDHRLQDKLAQRPRIRHERMKSTFLGPSFDRETILSALLEKSLVFEEYSAPQGDTEIVEEASKLLAASEVIAHFDGGMEFGPRALGNRSILADPRDSTMQSRVNNMIKFREAWRPFAPIVLEEDFEKFFLDVAGSPYMTMTHPFRAEFVSRLPDFKGNTENVLARLGQLQASFPAVTHVDGSARTQVLSETTPGRIVRILRAFRDLSGCSMLLNTSLNVRGEPIVCTPADAVACFLNTRVDALMIGNFLVRRKDQRPSINSHVGKTVHRAD